MRGELAEFGLAGSKRGFFHFDAGNPEELKRSPTISRSLETLLVEASAQFWDRRSR